MYNMTHLKNGIQVVHSPIEGTKSVAIGVWIGTGSNHELKTENGMSHLIEHMLFKGTQNRSAKALAEAIDGIGGSINAFTSKECTAYYCKVLEEDFDIALDVLTDMLMHSQFDPKELEKEIKVIKEEIAMYEDSPEDVVYELSSVLTYPDHPLGQPILGLPEVLSEMKRDDILAYMAKHYVTGNTIISIAGATPDDFLDRLENKFSNYPKGQQHLKLDEPVFRGGYNFAFKDIEQNHMCIAFDGIKLDSDLFYAMLLLSNHFGGTTSSRLFQTIREDNGLTYGIYSHPTFFKDAGNFSIYLSYQPDGEKDIIPLLVAEWRDLKKNFTHEQLISLKSQLRGSYLLGLEGSNSLMNWYGKRAIYQAPLQTLDEVINDIDAISYEQVISVIDALTESPFALSMTGKLTDEKVASIYQTLAQVMGGQA